MDTVAVDDNGPDSGYYNYEHFHVAESPDSDLESSSCEDESPQELDGKPLFGSDTVFVNASLNPQSHFSNSDKFCQTALKVLTCIPLIGLIGVIIISYELEEMSYFNRSLEALELKRDYLLCVGFQTVVWIAMSIALTVLVGAPLSASLVCSSLALAIVVFMLVDTCEEIDRKRLREIAQYKYV